MKNINRYVASIMLATTTLYTSFASEGYYIKGEFGVSGFTDIQEQDFNFTKKSLKKSILFGIESGINPSSNIRFGLNIGYQRNGAYKIDKKNYDSNYVDSFQLDKIKSMNAMANVYYDIVYKNGVTPYLKLALGVAKNKIGDAKIMQGYNLVDAGISPFGASAGTDSPMQNEVKYASASKTGTAWGVGAGLVYKLTDNLSLDFGYMYKDLGQISTKLAEGQTFVADFAEQYKVQDEYRSKLASHNINVGVIFKF